MTQNELKQAIDTEYQKYIELLNDKNASWEKATAQFEKYQALWDVAMAQVRGEA